MQTWDTEQVLAFVYDVRPWRDLDDIEKAVWCQRVKYVRDNVADPDGRPWINERLSGLFGITKGGLEKRFAWSKAEKGTTSAGPLPNRKASIRSAKSALRAHPELAADLVNDPQVRKSVIAAIANESEKDVTRQTKEMRAADEDTIPSDPATAIERNKGLVLNDWLNAVRQVEDVVLLFGVASPSDFTEEERSAVKDGHDRIVVALATVDMAVTPMEEITR